MGHRIGTPAWPGAGRIGNKDLGQRFTPHRASFAPAPRATVFETTRAILRTEAIVLPPAASARIIVPGATARQLWFPHIWVKGKPTLDLWRAKGIPDVTTRQIDYCAQRFTTAYGLPRDAIEDIKQDFILKVWSAIGDYDEERATPTAFANAVIRLEYCAMVREFHRKKKRGPVIVTVDEYADLLARADPAHGRSDLRVDMRTILDQLPDGLQALAEQLMTRSVAEIAAELGLHRGTVHRRLERLRDECGENFDKIR